MDIKPANGWSDLVRKDDWLGVWIAAAIFLVLLAGVAIKLPAWKWGSATELAGVFTSVNLLRLVPVFAGLAVLGAAAAALLRRGAAKFLLGFPVIFLVALVGFLIAGNATVSFYGMEYVFWALLLGLAIGNVFGVPQWLKPAVNTELYVKVGLVLLGAEVMLQTVMRMGVLGMVQAVVVISAVWYACYWLAGRFGLDKDFGAILATGVSVCGVSAAIAAGGALKGDPKKVSHTVSLVLIVALPMLVLMPMAGRWLNLGGVITGAWLGGTIDTTGAVAAAGTIAGKEALDMAVVVKMAQNALIGVVAFLLSMWAVMRRREGVERPRPVEIWHRFPKFVLGFIGASLVFSLLVPETVAKSVTSVTAGLRGYWFSLAFVSIGLETRIKDLVTMKGGRPAATFIAAQAFNIIWTLAVAGLLYSGILFPLPK